MGAKNLLTLLIAWSSAAHECSPDVVMKLPPPQIPCDGRGDEFHNLSVTDGLIFGLPAASTTPTAHGILRRIVQLMSSIAVLAHKEAAARERAAAQEGIMSELHSLAQTMALQQERN
ncbi:hypothetical protein HPB50_022113 [Hyalomma asiaticum]|uniref:Uncharacterized protein n=1 Tax=Hyalomma asiaticum TaxID=266040 RepID=A0ACB7TNN5_HYAAI|nr:hypothetical protein HPB50_022113 [Hyalomma asiaticum]